VEGSEFEPYQVSIQLHNGGVADWHCTCPYNWGGHCKHIVAVLLKFADEKTRNLERKSISELLRGLDQTRLVELLEKRAESDPDLAAWIEAELATAIPELVPNSTTAGRRRTPVDPVPVREQARALLAARNRRGRYWDGYRSSGDIEELQRHVAAAPDHGGEQRVAARANCRKLENPEDVLADIPAAAGAEPMWNF